jgi:predicted Zn-dependent peptidase
LFDNKEIEKEKQVVIEEIKNIEDDPDDLIHDFFDKRIFPKHALGFPVIGTADNIKLMTRDDLFKHMQNYYIPQRMVISAAGNIKHSAVVKLVEKYFKTHPHRNGSLKREQAKKQLRAGVQAYERPITQAHVCLGTIGYGVKDRHRYPLLVLNTLLGEGMSSRLFQNIREKYGFAYTVYSFANSLSDIGNFGVYVGTDKNNVQNCIELIHKELDKLKSKPVGSAELNRTKEQLKGNMMLSLENMSSRMMRLGSGELYFGEFIPLSDIVKKIDAVNVEQVQEVANKLFHTEQFTTVIFNPAENNSKRNDLN